LVEKDHGGRSRPPIGRERDHGGGVLDHRLALFVVIALVLVPQQWLVAVLPGLVAHGAGGGGKHHGNHDEGGDEHHGDDLSHGEGLSWAEIKTSMIIVLT